MNKPQLRVVVFINQSLHTIQREMQHEMTRSYYQGELASYHTLVMNPNTYTYHGVLGFSKITN